MSAQTPSSLFLQIQEFFTAYQPLIQLVAGAGLVAFIKFPWERNNRSADVLLKLETKFSACKEGKGLLNEQREYDRIASMLEASVRYESIGETKERDDVDKLLRFYVVLVGMQHAKQIPNRSASTCFRYWLGLYYRKDRREFRQYVNLYYPTLRNWLLSDLCFVTRCLNNPFSLWWKPFFRPTDFWTKDRLLLSREDLLKEPEGSGSDVSMPDKTRAKEEPM